MLPDLSKKGIVYFITSEFPPVVGGSSVINRNLLSKFSPKSYVVFTSDSKQKDKVDLFDNDSNIHRIFKTYFISKRLNSLINKLTLRSTVRKIIRQAHKDNPVAIIGAYPNYYALKIAREVSLILKIPFFPYLHDTVYESRINNILEAESKILQDQIFKEAKKVFVMSEGMKDLYKKKYNINSIPIEHTYLEKIPESKGYVQLNKKAFWGGYIYNININSVRRILNALSDLKIQTFLATPNTVESLVNAGISMDHVKIGFFSNRSEYLEKLNNFGILILALDWPEESPIHEDELSTIFPTKTPEYLASGNLILVHCPEHYFLARFFRERACGIVISDKSGKTISSELSDILNDENKIKMICENALKAAEIFDSNIISQRISNHIDD